ncbi:MAG: flagellar export protein FliJ [Candidatus Krumholzibacteriota bacterium]|nr:flagellar export protein FliJ [Candidatus Krumholzibacteriota bacterium]
MAGFRFRLEKVLRLRRRAEREASRELGRAASARDAQKRRLAAMAEARAELLAHRDDLQRGHVQPALLTQNRYQIIVLERAEVRGRARLAELEREVAAARDRLVEKSRARKLLEKLEERRRREWTAEQARRERRELDSRPLRNRGMPIAMKAAAENGR